jgi:hypothetical protein
VPTSTGTTPGDASTVKRPSPKPLTASQRKRCSVVEPVHPLKPFDHPSRPIEAVEKPALLLDEPMPLLRVVRSLGRKRLVAQKPARRR